MTDTQTALGMVETRGLVAAIEAADAMVKAARVRLLGKEVTRPALVTIKVLGETGAVRSSVAAGAAAAERVGEVISTHIIPRPHDQVAELLLEADPVTSVAAVVQPVAPVGSVDLQTMSVRELRDLARRTVGLDIQGRDISRANKQQLVEQLSRVLH